MPSGITCSERLSTDILVGCILLLFRYSHCLFDSFFITTCFLVKDVVEEPNQVTLTNDPFSSPLLVVKFDTLMVNINNFYLKHDSHQGNPFTFPQTTSPSCRILPDFNIKKEFESDKLLVSKLSTCSLCLFLCFFLFSPSCLLRFALLRKSLSVSSNAVSSHRSSIDPMLGFFLNTIFSSISQSSSQSFLLPTHLSSSYNLIYILNIELDEVLDEQSWVFSLFWFYWEFFLLCLGCFENR
ncbi:hypothetical protein AGLY_001149 [Aphis glycines]|uniref:Uncharacterized protein n=1 Tax=Aphis glycines TaxID=307491 RepID=A0A6G0UBG8_APHGL|nr:hypothetical protein AGLY_001149 [Aphis glycines]